MKSKLLKLVMISVVTTVFCIVAVAENTSEATGKKEILTGLGQRMLKRISVDFRNTEIDDVIRIMAEQADVDIVKSPNVTGEVTATLTNVPLEEALNNILAAHGYGYVASKNMIRIAPLSEISAAEEKLINRIYRITYADVAEVEKSLKNFISKRGTVSSNPGTSNVIVTDTESNIKAIDTFINEIDRITPQILVEVRIYDITSKDRYDLGIQWQAGRDTSILSALGSNPTAGKVEPFVIGTSSSSISKATTPTGTLRFGWFNTTGIDLDMILTAEHENINAKLLANPRILVLDNEQALIKIISEIPYQELTETSGGGSIGTTEFREVGVELVVIPHVTRDEMVRLRLKPKFSVKQEDVTVGTGTSNLFSQPVIDRREADTTLLVKNGQTVVLGGLRKKEVSQQQDSVPFLSDIPIIGELFKFEGEDTITSELVVFITPRIVEQPVLTDIEKQAYQETEFEGPVPIETRSERSVE
jgi:type IV pilus assembly protein PilQ